MCSKSHITWQCCLDTEEGVVLLGKVTVYYRGRKERADYWGGVAVAQCVELSCFVEWNNGVVLGSRKDNVVSIRAVITRRNVACSITFIARPQNEETRLLLKGRNCQFAISRALFTVFINRSPNVDVFRAFLHAASLQLFDKRRLRVELEAWA